MRRGKGLEPMPTSATSTDTSATRFSVYPHCECRRQTGRGLVVRGSIDGRAIDQYNYGGVEPLATFGKRKAAEHFADTHN